MARIIQRIVSVFIVGRIGLIVAHTFIGGILALVIIGTTAWFGKASAVFPITTKLARSVVKGLFAIARGCTCLTARCRCCSGEYYQ